MNLNFSFIIPHKNNPQLLKRCLDSIPKREDVEIIVVDDNSNEIHKATLNELDVNVIYLDDLSSKGAGRARNIGLKNAKGKWLFFIDADDSFDDCISVFLDDLLKIKENVVYYNYSIVKNDTRIPSKSTKIEREHDVDRLKYKITAPWNKVVKRQFVIDNNILFEECPAGNDIMYSFQVAYYSKENFKIIDKSVYNYYINADSIVHRRKNNSSYYFTILMHVYQINNFFDRIGLHSFKRPIWVQLCAILYKKGFQQFCVAVRSLISDYKSIVSKKNYYVDLILKQR